VFKKVVNTKNISIDQMKNSIDKVRARNNKDKIDKIALQSYDSLVKFKQQQLQFEIGSGF
jgi:ribosomal protein L14E/L6E/L27E